jgi:hypothetical protein
MQLPGSATPSKGIDPWRRGRVLFDLLLTCFTLRRSCASGESLRDRGGEFVVVVRRHGVLVGERLGPRIERGLEVVEARRASRERPAMGTCSFSPRQSIRERDR